MSGCFVAETLRELETAGVTSTVIAVDSIYHPRRLPNRSFPAEWIRYLQVPGNLGLASAGKFLSAVISGKVQEIHRASPISVIHAHAALPCGHAAAILSRRLGIPFVVTIHGLDVFNCCFENGIAARRRRKASLGAYAEAATVICVSERIRKVLKEGTGSVRAEVAYNGTDVRRFAPGPSQTETQTILMVGNLLAGKGQELVLRAIAALKASHPALRCDLIGDGADKERFARLADDLRIRDRVHFFGRMDRDAVADAMRSCTIFALPSRFEGLGCVYLEAMACGKPVIACRGQGIDEIIDHGNNGWLIPIDGLKELVEGLEVLLANRDLRQRIGKAARNTVANGLTLSQQAQKLIQIYERAAS